MKTENNPLIVDKKYLVRHYKDILTRGNVPSAYIAALQAGKTDECGRMIVQSTSGTTGRPLLIPRSPADIADTARRTAMPFIRHFGRPPVRAALLGGVSHINASRKLQMAGTVIESFGLNTADALAGFNPEVLACYPSIARELCADRSLRLPALRMIKLGGERIFTADVTNLLARFPGILILEQAGSTEMPAIAFRYHNSEHFPREYCLETKRFLFHFEGYDGWQPVYVRDLFPEQHFPIPGYYDTGDEFFFMNGKIIDYRRRNDPAVPFYPRAEQFLAAGCVHLQFDRGNRRVLAGGSEILPTEISIGDSRYKVTATRPVRSKPSNKMALTV